jgi:ribonuclease HII
MQLGVDEAGKGPVLGSMFAACVRARVADLPDGVTDSKRLSADRRESLAAAIRERADAVAVVEIPVERIDAPETDMNELTVAAHAEALSQVARDGLPAYLDAGDTNAVRFERRVDSRVDANLELRAEHGADEAHPIVSAASIVAKVRRDAHVADLAAEYDIRGHGEVGSGYPSDDTTREFLRSYVEAERELPPCARRSWQTSQDALAALDQSSLEDF